MDVITEHAWEQVEEKFEAAIEGFDLEVQGYLTLRWEELEVAVDDLPFEIASKVINYLRQVMRSGPSQDELVWMFDEALKRTRFPWKS